MKTVIKITVECLILLMGWPLINHIIAVTTKFPIEDLTPEYYAIIALARSLYLMVSIVVLISSSADTVRISLKNNVHAL